MVRKRVQKASPAARTPRKKSNGSASSETHPLVDLALRACLVASDAAFNIKDYLTNGSRMAFLSVRDCEKELDRIEQEIDQRLPRAISDVDEMQARELLACLRFSTELERIGDLLWGVCQRVQDLREPLPKSDSEQLIEIVAILQKMLEQIREGFTERELDPASYVLRADREIDYVYKAFFRRHLHNGEEGMQEHAELLLIAQALERAGDHATNLAEELFRLVEGRSLRHIPKKQLRE
jgi:phosphate transport system protein